MAREPVLILDCSSYSKEIADIIKLFNEIVYFNPISRAEYFYRTTTPSEISIILPHRCATPVS